MVFLVLNRKMLVRAAEKHITPLRIERYTFDIAGVCVFVYECAQPFQVICMYVRVCACAVFMRCLSHTHQCY